MLWVADTGPLLHLHQAGLLDLLKHESKIVTTPAVVREWRSKARSGVLPEWIQEEQPEQRARDNALDWMRRGLLDADEAEALAHALETGADGFFADDTAAREMASKEGLAVRGSLGVVLMAAARNYLTISQSREAWNRLATQSTLWISPALRRETTEALESILAKRSR